MNHILHELLQKILYDQSRILAAISHLERGMSKEMDDLKAEVTRVRTVEQSAVVLITSIRQQLADVLANDDDTTLRADLQEMHDDLEVDTAALATAVGANTGTPTPNPTIGRTAI